jgi:hypothetical protein
MSASGSVAEFGVKHLSIRELLTDSDGAPAPTYGSEVDVPGIQTFSYEFNNTSETLTGDDKILAIQTSPESINIDIEHGKLSHAVKAILEGGTHTLAATPSGKSSSQYSLKGSNTSKYFRIDATLVRTDKPNTTIRVIFYKVKVTSSSGERSYGAFKTNSFSAEAVYTTSNDALYDEFELEGATTDDTLMAGPQVSLTSPLDAATGVALSANTVVTFDKAMDDDFATTAFFSLYNVTGSAAITIGTPGYASNAFTLNPSTDMPASSVIQCTVSGAVRDENGNPLGQPYIFTFTTAAS